MGSGDNDVLSVTRREAKSGRVSYSNPVVLHDTSKRRVTLVPFYIRRSSGTELAVKLITHRKVPSPPTWILMEEKSLSLDEQASRALLKGLKQHLAVAESGDDGSYILIRVSEGTAQIGKHDPKAVAGALAKVLSRRDIMEHIGETELSEELIKAFRGAIHLKEMRSAVSQLRQYLESGEDDEQMYLRWCEHHTWAFGNAYVMRDEVRNISPTDQLDILLPTVISRYRDIIELKRPSMKVLIYDDAHRNYYFSADVSRAIGQCHRYLDVLHEVASQGLRDHPQVVAYHPRATIVIGRSEGWEDSQLRALHGLNRRLAGIAVMTYDQMLAQGERLLEFLSSKPETEASDEYEAIADDEIPF